MGLGAFKSAWQRQTLHFGHEQSKRYSVLILDNRGMGDSDVPLMRYSTSEMARDVVEVLEHVGWLPRGVLQPSSSTPPTPPPERTLHVLGISMGGMIAQELACLVPQHLSTLNLLCTAAAVENTTTFWENMAQRAQMLIPKPLEQSIRGAAESMFPASFISAPDEGHLPDTSGSTPGVLPPGGAGVQGVQAGDVGGAAAKYLHFGTNWERFVAGEMHKRVDAKRFTTQGFLLQLIAAGWHHKSREQLAAMADRVGRGRILVLHGTADRMISVPHGRKLIDFLGGTEGTGLVGLIRPDMGHGPPFECTEWFHELIEERVRKGEELDGRELP